MLQDVLDADLGEEGCTSADENLRKFDDEGEATGGRGQA